MNILLPNVLLFFAPLSAFLYHLISGRFGRIHGLRSINLCSLIFLACLPLIDIYLLIASIVINYAIVRFRLVSKRHQLCGAILINILIFFVFRYLPAYMPTATLFGKNIRLDWAPPIGISYFTFLQIAYLVDSYRGDIKEVRLSEYFAYITFFPKFISGPLVRYNQFCSELDGRSDSDLSIQGWLLIGIGVIKKIYLANFFATLADAGYGHESYSFYSAWLVSMAYTFQIYFDFSAYTDIARGLAKLFGINLPYNFNSPYKSTSIRDFWRRWHISLSFWLRDYIYIPLGGSRVPEFRVYLNIMITFMICGIWHGSTLTFFIWGLYHGCGLSINRLFSKSRFNVPKFLSISLTFLFIHVGWIIFRSKSWHQAFEVIFSLLQFNDRSLNPDFEITIQLLYRFLLAAVLVFFAPNSHKISKLYQFASSNIRVYLRKLGRRISTYAIASYVSLLIIAFFYYNGHIDTIFYELFPGLTHTAVTNKRGDYRNNMAAQQILHAPGKKVIICGSSFCKSMGFYSWDDNGMNYISGTIATGGNSLATGLRQAFYVLDTYAIDTIILGVSPLNFHQMKSPRGPFKDQGSELINMALGENRWPEYSLHRLIPDKWNFVPIFLLVKNPVHASLFQFRGFLFNISNLNNSDHNASIEPVLLNASFVNQVKSKIVEQAANANRSVLNQTNGANVKFKWESRGIIESLTEDGDAYKMIRQLKRMCDKKGVHLVVYDTPTASHQAAPSVYPDGFLQTYSETISTAMHKMNIDYYDLTGLFPFKDEFFIDFIHLHPKTRKLVHKYLLSEIFGSIQTSQIQ